MRGGQPVQIIKEFAPSIAGATRDRTLPVGKHALQLHSLATSNGEKVTILLEELPELGIAEAEYGAYLVNVGEGEQFGSGFVAITPNSKMLALADHSTSPLTWAAASATSTPTPRRGSNTPSIAGLQVGVRAASEALDKSWRKTATRGPSQTPGH